MNRCKLSVVFLCFLAASIADCSPSRQSTGAQQQASAPASDQGIQGTYGGTDVYSALIGDGLMVGAPGVYNSKRARKMSAFMPMRGRKDGRDEARYLEPSADDTFGMINGSPLRESEGESSILRLVAANGQPLGTFYDAAAQEAGARSRWLGAPQRFANQFAIQHVQQQQQPLMRSYESADLIGGQVEPMTLMDSGMATGGGPSSSLMQAKFRRAFQPMRGKKSMGVAGGELAGLLDEI